MPQKAGDWYKLDNAALMYSMMQKERYSAIYRFSAVMNAPVDKAALQRAIDYTMPRFPTFAVKMRKGLFWYYFEHNTAPGPFVKKDVSDPCQPVRYHEDNGWLVRFYAYDRRISVECFHSLSDGAGAMTFFKTVLAVYLRELGVDVPDTEGVLPIHEQPRKEEFEDAYSRYARPHAKKLKRKYETAYSNIGTPEPFYTFHVTMGFLSVKALKEKSKSYGASITEYLAAVLIHTILEKQKRESPYRLRPVALAVPVNLRSLFPSETLRNFMTTVRVDVDPAMGDYTFKEILARVHHQMRLQVTRQEQISVIAGNVKMQRNHLLQAVPVVLKNPVILLSYKKSGIDPYSATFTNPGQFKVPKEMEPYIHHMEVVLGQATVPRVHCSTISYGDTMEITLAGTQAENDTEREFFRFLVRDGLHVKIESNRTE